MNFNKIIQHIDSGNVFSLRVVSFDKSRKTGGEIKFYSELKVSTKKEERESNKNNLISTKKDHYDNATRTCYQCINGVETASLVTFHIFLMLEVNGEKVML
jgi:hypothetical protein